jgi:hypothetical protein
MKMRNFLFFFAGATSLAFAQTPITNNANLYAQQAGVIAGVAQACGQNVGTFSSRSAEVINLLTKIPAEQQQAMTIYEKVMATSQMNQVKNHAMKCPDVISAYNSLPLLRDDYKQKVLPAMENMGTTPNAS